MIKKGKLISIFSGNRNLLTAIMESENTKNNDPNKKPILPVFIVENPASTAIMVMVNPYIMTGINSFSKLSQIM